MAILIMTRCLILGLLVILITLSSINTNVFCQNDKSDKILQEIVSDDFLKRRAAQNALTEYLDNIEESKRGEVIDGLLLRIHDKKSSTRLKTGISYSIGQIRTFFWKVKDQKKAEKNLYEFFKQTDDPTLKKILTVL